MSKDAFSIGIDLGIDKIAAGNPAQPQKSSKGGMERDEAVQAPYLSGGGKAGAQTAGEVQKSSQPWPGYVNIGDKKPGKQVGGDVEGRGGSPDTGEKGSTRSVGDSQSLSKNASAYEIGMYLAIGEVA